MGLNLNYMIKPIAITSFILSIFVFNKCGEKDCPGFPPSFLKWSPYSIMDTLKFSDGHNLLTFSVIQKSATSPYSFKKSCKCECDADMGFKAIQIGGDSQSIIGSFSALTNNDPREYYLDCHLSILGNEFFFGITANQVSFYYNRKSYPMSDTLISEINHRMVALTVDLSNSNELLKPVFKVGKIFYVEGIGLIKFQELESSKKWELVEH